MRDQMRRALALVLALFISLLTFGCGGGGEDAGGASPADEAAAAPAAEPATATDEEEETGDWREMKLEGKRAKIDETADAALTDILGQSEKAKELYDNSVGWAVLDNLKIAVLISGGGGKGVAVLKASGHRTYMKMGTGGIGLGIGDQKYQVLFLFQDETTFNNFVENGWQADTSAQAAAGTEGANVAAGFVNGMAISQVTESGLMASVDISGTRYWQYKKLNE